MIVRTVLITLIGPDLTADLVVDAETPVQELMGSLLTSGGVDRGADPGDWGVAVMGRQPLAAERTLADSEVLDGAVLVLRRDLVRPDEPVAGPMTPTGPAGSPLEHARRRLAGAGALEPAITGAAPLRCATIAVVSPKGGVGKTTLSILLAEALASLRSDVVLALDADGDYGSLGRVGPADVAAPAAGSELARPGRDDEIFIDLGQGAVTFAELDRRVWKLHQGARIVPSPRDPAVMARTDRAAYARVIGNLQRLAGVLVVDCGTGLAQPGVQAGILACDQLVVVTDATGATISLAQEAVSLLERAGRPITIVANRLPRGRAAADDLARLDASFPRAADLYGVPHDPAAELALRGEFALERAPGALRDAVVQLAAGLVLAWSEVGLAAPDSNNRPSPGALD